ncbi:MAG: hypothetical protein KJN92_09890, partial [Gemmatimonadetes bacterium]|nr:hypothetical protein [Gemmatimonadota bacterium]
LVLPALLGIDLLLIRDAGVSGKLRFLLTLGFFGFPVWKASEGLGFQPLFVLLVGMFIWMNQLCLSSRDSDWGSERELGVQAPAATSRS